MNRVGIVFLFVVAIAVSVVTNAITATSAPTPADPAATVERCANCPKQRMDCANCPKRATCACANCSGSQDCPQMKGEQGNINCANCPEKECPKQAATVPCDKCPKKAGN